METKTRHSANIRRISVLSVRRQKASERSDGSSKSRDVKPLAIDYDNDCHVKVVVRCRPMSEKELSAGYESIVEFESNKRIVVHDVSEQPSEQLGTNSGERRNISRVYDFDHVFDCESKQSDIYDQVCRPLVDSVLAGYNGTIFAYGQTGTGKTYTMEGANDKLWKASPQQRHGSSGSIKSEARRGNPLKELSDQKLNNKSQTGIIPRAFEQIFDYVRSHPDFQFLIRASYLEVYQEEIRDLLRKGKATNKLELHERADIGVYVKDLTSFVCKSMDDIERVMRVGNQNRIVGATDMNEHSSRSHAIFTITVEQQRKQQTRQLETKLQGQEAAPRQNVNEEARNSETVIRVGKLNLVDLAGSERQRKTNSFGQRQKESIKINLSLSALGNVINSLMKLQQQREQKQQVAYECSTKSGFLNNASIHTPYRDSKLTRLLQDSLGGNAKTLMIANIGPASYNYDETINTLNYASRARCIKNRPRLNEDPKDALLRQLQQEIEVLRAKLAERMKSSGASDCNTTAIGDHQSSGVSSAKSSRGSSGSTNWANNSAQTNKLDATSIRVNNKSDDEINNYDNKRLLVEREFFELKQKLSSLEGKLLNSCNFGQITSSDSQEGTKHELDQSILKVLTERQREELEKHQEELADQMGRERAIRDELERREEAELIAKQSFESVQQEIEAKRRLIWQVLLKVKSIRDELSSNHQSYRIELDELEQLQFVLQRELKLKCLIMDNFIPNEHVDQLISRVCYDERRNLCTIKPLELTTSIEQIGACLNSNGESEDRTSGNVLEYLQHLLADTNSKRPQSDLERLSETINPSNIRYKRENLIEPNLMLGSPTAIDSKPRRLADELGEQAKAINRDTTQGQVGENSDSRLQVMINDALNQREPDIVI